MSYRRYKKSDPAQGLILLYFLYMGSLWFTNKVEFFKWLLFNEILLLIICLGIFAWWEFKRRKKQKEENILKEAISNGVEEIINNFISRFGTEKSKEAWNYRGYYFDWKRMEEFRLQLKEKGVPVSLDKWDVFISILKKFIDKREEKVTRESVNVLQNKFSDLSGTNFENLLYRLYTVQGYTVQKTGKTGDQGGDLIANKNPDRILIQAKCYNNSPVGNAGVQDAAAAKGFYDCNKAMVITSSNFTKDAIDLAKKDNIELIEKRRLSELLLQYLNESWN